VFIDPAIRSLFDAFIKVVGLFMGVLGGLFALGMLTRSASGAGSLIGVVAGAGVMFSLPFVSRINGYLYTAIGITVCFVVGWLASQFLPADGRDLTGLTWASRNRVLSTFGLGTPPARGRQKSRPWRGYAPIAPRAFADPRAFGQRRGRGLWGQLSCAGSGAAKVASRARIRPIAPRAFADPQAFGQRRGRWSLGSTQLRRLREDFVHGQAAALKSVA
jgi:hypothetical protein